MALASAIAIGCALAPAPAQAVYTNGKLQVIHLDAGQGDAAAIITPGGQVVMIDDGTNFSVGTSGPSCARVLSELQALGITRVDLHFASHYHADHIGCITSLAGITIAQGWDRGQSYSSTAFTNYVNYLGTNRHTLTKGQVFTLDSLSAHPVTIKCVALAGDGISTSDENSKCLVLKPSYCDYDEVFGGDLTGYPSGTSSSNTNIETQVGPQVGKVEVYKIHHHGSAYTSYDDWLNATTPKVGIISCGTGNTYGHPTSSALTRLHAHNVRTYWTELGSGVAPVAPWDKVANNQIRINAVWQPGGVDSIIAPGIADTLTNSGTPSTWAIQASAGSNGTIVPSGTIAVAGGASQGFTILADPCYAVASVVIDGNPVGAVTSYSFSNVTAAHTLAATFALNVETITATTGAGGAIGPAGAVAVNCGSDRSFTFTAEPCYHIADVLADGASVGAVGTYSFTNVTTHHTLAASFALDAYTILASAGPNGDIAPNNSVVVNCGGSQSFTFTPAACFVVADVVVDAASVGAVTSYSFSNVTAAHTLAATFALASQTITASAGAGGAITPAGAVVMNCGGDQPFTITAGPCHHILDVLVDGASFGAVGSYAFSNVTAAHTIAARFAADAFTLAVTTVGSGSVTRSPDQPDYACGANVQLAATASPGWAFAGWSGDTTAVTNPLTLALGSDKNVTATFVDIEAPLVQLTSPIGGEWWTEGDAQAIRWTAADNVAVDSVDVDFSLTGADGPWIVAAHGLANSGSYAWTVPMQLTDSALVRVIAYDHALNSGSATSDTLFHIGNATLGVGSPVSSTLMLAQPEPNPSSGAARVRFSLPRAGSARLDIIDLGGRRVWTQGGTFAAGAQSWRWEGSTVSGARAGAGLYFVRLSTPWGDRVQRLVLLR